MVTHPSQSPQTPDGFLVSSRQTQWSLSLVSLSSAPTSTPDTALLWSECSPPALWWRYRERRESVCGYSSDIDRDIEALVISIVVVIPEGVEFARKIEYYIKHYG